MNSVIAPHPFGDPITEETLLQEFSACLHWEERYRQLILLSRKLPPLTGSLKTPQTEITGCENKVWLGSQLQDDGRLHFYGDSEGRIVKGLLAILLTVSEGKTPAQIADTDLLAIFGKLGLQDQLSASRSQGLEALATAIHQAALSA